METKLLKEIIYKNDENGQRVIDEQNSFDFTPYIRSYQVDYSDMDASNERSASGKSVRDFIRTVITVRCTFRSLNTDEAKKILSVLDKKQLNLGYFDTLTGEFISAEDKLLFAYPSVTRSTSLYGTNPNIIYNEISADFIEF